MPPLCPLSRLPVAGLLLRLLPPVFLGRIIVCKAIPILLRPYAPLVLQPLPDHPAVPVHIGNTFVVDGVVRRPQIRGWAPKEVQQLFI